MRRAGARGERPERVRGAGILRPGGGGAVRGGANNRARDGGGGEAGRRRRRRRRSGRGGPRGGWRRHHHHHRSDDPSDDPSEVRFGRLVAVESLSPRRDRRRVTVSRRVRGGVQRAAHPHRPRLRRRATGRASAFAERRVAHARGARDGAVPETRAVAPGRAHEPPGLTRDAVVGAIFIEQSRDQTHVGSDRVALGRLRRGVRRRGSFPRQIFQKNHQTLRRRVELSERRGGEAQAGPEALRGAAEAAPGGAEEAPGAERGARGGEAPGYYARRRREEEA